MLKRQRAPSPLPDFPQVSHEVALDVHERVVKRRRHLAPPSNGPRGSAINGGEEEEDDEDDQTWLLDEGRPEYSRGISRWQEEAGLYKAANTLLHDLHAEQRHRMTFSSSSSSTTPLAAHEAHSPLDNGAHMSWLSYPTKDPCSPIHGAPSQIHQEHPKHVFFDDAIPPAEAEGQSVTQRYEDTNRYLGSLFLSRRRLLDTHEDHEHSP
ncbi:hypothetical protein SCP_0110310 [Sparassis crispa]|uniref:Uncharacterized protein n=1 Tax=Sparassis crispa TaxID=139825 RepID=A0A401G7M4_9APHY|nr:hypothetical protein SCP_0110310 [Sparassis crispa]GBE78148.1 hypothetical protein SCP_0110310 [Sparassis crispa]